MASEAWPEEPGAYQIINPKVRSSEDGVKTEEAHTEGSELETLRRLVLGTVVSDYQRQVAAMREKLAEAESGLKGERDKLRVAVEEALGRAGASLEETRGVKDSLLEHNQMLKALADSMKDVEKNFAELHGEMQASFEGIRAEHGVLTSFVYGELQGRMAALENASMSGTDLSEMLVELAGRVRQTRPPSMAAMEPITPSTYGLQAMAQLQGMGSSAALGIPQPVPEPAADSKKVEEADIEILEPTE
ncbi:MAG: hypothetical protein HYV07_26855 [Deltaproteobacteria bacterium]|nr:hypothetical protein [Deltaproteobacteria bacterium]